MLNLDQGGWQRLDGVQNLFLQEIVLDDIQRSLDHIVSELVVDKLLDNKVDTSLETLLKLEVVLELGDDLLVVLRESALEDLVDVSLLLIVTLWIQALFNYIAWEFHFAQSDKILSDLHENLFIFRGVFKFEDVLDQVISILIFDQVVHVLDNVVGQFKLLCSGSFLQASLHDTATMFVHSDVHTVFDAGIENKLSVLGGELTSGQVLFLRRVRSFEDHKESLDDMIAVHVLGQIDYLKVERIDNLGKDRVVSGLGTNLNSLGLRDVLVSEKTLVFFENIRG